MRLALVAHDVITSDGQGRANYEVARYALSRGANVTLLADRVAPELLECGAEWWPIHPRVQRPNLLKVQEFVWRTNRVLSRRGQEFDVVCATGYVLSRPHQVNCAQFVHGAWRRSPSHTFRVRRDWYGLYQFLYTVVNAAAERTAFGRAKVVVAVSTMVAQELISVGVPEGKIRVISNGVDVAEFQFGRGNREALGLPSDQLVALFVGDLRTPRKNLDTVLKALIQVPSACLAVVGDTNGSVYPQMAHSMGLGGRVHFLGFRRDVQKIMQAADVFVFPSRYDPCPLVIFEAMASGLPVITARSVGSAPSVAPECGYVLEDPEDVGGLVTALNAVIADPERRQAMGRAARRTAESHSWERVAASYWTLFQAVR